MPFGLSNKGFKRKRYADIRSDLAARWKEKFGENSRTDERSVNGIIISLIAYATSPLWMLLENIYNSAYVDTATGNQLNHVGKYIAISKHRAQPSTSEITITGDPGTLVDRGFMVGTSTNIPFETIQEAVVQPIGTVKVAIKSIENGNQTNVPGGSITEILIPLVGVSGVVNEEPATGGRDEEADHEFRQRYDLSVTKAGSSTVESIRATLLNIEGVRDAIVRSNDTEVEVNGIPAKSIAPFVFGGETNDIARAIFGSKTGGVRSYGETVVVVEDSQNEMHNIGFTRPATLDFYADIKLTTNYLFPANGYELVRSKVVEYIGGLEEDGTEHYGLGLGGNVIFTKVISAIHEVDGIEDIELSIGTDPNDLTIGNIVIELGEVIKTDWEKVVVT